MFNTASQVPYNSYMSKANKGHSNMGLFLNPHLNQLTGLNNISIDHETSNPVHFTHLVSVSLIGAQCWVL